MRKLIMSLAVAAVLLPLAACEKKAETPLAPSVKTESGALRGATDGGVLTFKGIPYGASTAGEARFLPPQKPTAWQGERDATAFGPRCPQPDIASFMPAATKVVLAHTISSDPISEDCLVLNVWTPATDDKKRPVFVWFHGGGLWIGSGQDPVYDGTNLAGRNDIVVVSVNHRLGLFGFLTLGDEAGPAYAAAGMAGMEDLVLSLRWVRDNIAAFGGDPDSVTIGGQSGGGFKVSTLMGMPAAQGLFHKAVVMSGAGVTAPPKEAALKAGERVLGILGVTAQDIDKLQTLPLADLVDADMKAGIAAFMTSIDGTVLPASPFDPEASEYSRNVPILIGATHDEAANLAMNDPNFKPTDEDGLMKSIAAALKDEERAKKTIAFYQGQYPNATPQQLLTSISSDMRFWPNSITLAERRVAQVDGAPLYMYRFDWGSPVLANTAPHAVDLAFWFDNIDMAAGMLGNGPDRQPLATAMSHALVAFMRTDDPSTPELPAWPEFSEENRDTMLLNKESTVVQDPAKDIRLYWKGEGL